MHVRLLWSLIPITPRLRDTTSLARTGRASTRWRGYNRSFRGATGTFCNCQRANLSDERVLHAASRPHTTPAIIISYTIVSRSPRGGGGVAGASRGESNGRNLYPTPAFQGSRCTVWIREFTHVRPIHAHTHTRPGFDSSGVTTFDTFAEISSGWQRVEGEEEAMWNSTDSGGEVTSNDYY